MLGFRDTAMGEVEQTEYPACTSCGKQHGPVREQIDCLSREVLRLRVLMANAKLCLDGARLQSRA